MTDPADFLSRWSQRKHAAAKGAPDRKAALGAEPVKPADAPDTAANEDDPRTDGETPAEAAREQPQFDLSTLPSIETITAATDIRPFLAAGVPAALRQAALRRMWSADPAIRDFIEMAENQWDFNAPGAIPGFDLAAPTGDVKRMVAQMFGEKDESDSRPEVTPEEGRAGETPAAEADAAVHGQTPKNATPADRKEPSVAVQRDHKPVQPSLVAQHNEVEGSEPQSNEAARHTRIHFAPRSHGGAMPK